MDAEIGGDLFQRDAGLAIARDPHDVLAELFRIRLGHCDILPGRLSASQVKVSSIRAAVPHPLSPPTPNREIAVRGRGDLRQEADILQGVGQEGTALGVGTGSNVAVRSARGPIPAVRSELRL
ncbi:hypothetical protein GCM10020227_22650 [Streptomyces flavovirens]